MTLNLVKLCVGVSDPEWLERRADEGRPLIVHTRSTPRRGSEVEDGGSLYWVIKGVILCRQPVLEIRTLGEGKASRCEILLKPEVIRTAPMARRAFQGWRYLETDIPPDLDRLDAGEVPDDLARELREIGAW
jgi:hypothetical protein